jgi:hypothetical protein
VFGHIGTTFRELDWENSIGSGRVVPISPNASYGRRKRPREAQGDSST